MNKDVLILGGGPAGMASAFELHKANKSFDLIEKNTKIGGLAKTFQYGEFRTDIGPHRFFSQNQYLYDLIEDLIGKRWIKVNRLTRFYINNKFYNYPIELKTALYNVGIYKAFRIISDYLYEKSKKIFIKKPPSSFEEQIVSDFGRTLAELNMLNYTEKVWGLPCSQISNDWSKQRIKGLSIRAIVKKIILKSRSQPKTLVDQFYYPDTGTALIYEKIKEKISSGNKGAVKTKSSPVKINHSKDKITGVVVESNGKKTTYKSKNIISSIPITEVIALMQPKAPGAVLKAAKKLKFRSHVFLFITLNKESVFPDQWLYFPDREIPFGRIMEPKNFSKKLCPPKKTSMLIEFFCWENDNVWNMSKEGLFDLSIGPLEKAGFIKKKDVIDIYVHREKYAYVVYDLDYKKNLKKVKDYLKKFKNLQLIGRAGSFRYNNQDHALEMGILAARSILENKKYDIDEVGSEGKYFERGYVK
ncbi:MAG: NAD(P)-binding protein [Candidatus Aenigmarchaeota archaeon]|nr:NAD(P)-binding protein [Candidatus Aenigmarchaeota archaeon]